MYQGRLGPLVDLQYASDNTHKQVMAATKIPFDDTIPQDTEGEAYSELDVTIRPKSRASILRYSFLSQSIAVDALQNAQVAIFQSGVAGAIAVGSCHTGGISYRKCLPIYGELIPGSTDPITFNTRVSDVSGSTLQLHGTTTRAYGGVVRSSFQVEEYLPVDFRSRVAGWPGRVKQVGTQYTDTNAYGSIATAVPADDTIPQITEGGQVVAGATYFPKRAGSILRIRAGGPISASAVRNMAYSLFRNSDADALSTASIVVTGASHWINALIRHYYTVTAADVSNGVSFSTRLGNSAGTTSYFNGVVSGRLMGGASTNWLIVDEFEVRDGS